MKVAILYISHRMSDIRQIADSIVSMRDGKISGQFNQNPLYYEAAVTAMLVHRRTECNVNITSRRDAGLLYKSDAAE